MIFTNVSFHLPFSPLFVLLLLVSLSKRTKKIFFSVPNEMSKDRDDGIRIYLRLRPLVTPDQSSLMNSAVSNGNHSSDYEVDHTMDRSVFKLHVDKQSLDGGASYVDHTREDFHFSFRRVLEPTATQEQVFSTVAKDCVQSVLDGYNSTIFAYGQTGSGKTFSITGGTESYDDRGIIPRSLAMIYEAIGKRKDINWTVSLSYLQIYNDRGQDLLNHGKDALRLEDLPTVTIHEGEDEIVLKNLEQHCSPTLSDALSLLFLGDTNRLYCETPMNKTSSRSHCIFMISLEAREVGSSVVRRSKLNLVDLAGSERVSKTGVEGVILNEAKFINLSLHYLEHVIISLSEQAKGKRNHVPYRNSFMTMVLRDSLGSNCRTSMLATVHTVRSVIPETISTCQFAQRVALIRQNAHLNEETDPVLLVKKMRAEISQLKDQLAFAEKGGGGAADRELTSDEHHMCELMVNTYLRSQESQCRIEGFDGDLARIYDCFAIMKQMIISGSSGFEGKSGTSNHGGGVPHTLLEERTVQLDDYKSQVDALQVSLQQKENEMSLLVELLQKTNGPKSNATTQTTVVGDEDGRHFRHQTVTSPSNHTSGVSGPTNRSYSNSRSEDSLRRSNPYSDAASRVGESHYSSASNMEVDIHKSSDGVSVMEKAANSGCVGHPIAMLPSPLLPETTLALANVQKMQERGKLSVAQVTAVTGFLQEKEEYLRQTQSSNSVEGDHHHDTYCNNGVMAPLMDQALLQNRAAALELFKQSYKGYEKVEAMKGQLKAMYEECKSTGVGANAINERIKLLKKEILRHRAERAVEGVEEVSVEEQKFLDKLREEKQVFTTYIEKVKKQKEEIQGIEAYLERSKDQLGKHFEDWLHTRQRQVQLALQASSPSSVETSRAGGTVSQPNGQTMPKNTGETLSPSPTLQSPTSPVPLFQPPTAGAFPLPHGCTLNPSLLDACAASSVPSHLSLSSPWYPNPPSSAPASSAGGRLVGSLSHSCGERPHRVTSSELPTQGVNGAASCRSGPASSSSTVPQKSNGKNASAPSLSTQGSPNGRVEEGGGVGVPPTHLFSLSGLTSNSGRSMPFRLQPLSSSLPPTMPISNGSASPLRVSSPVLGSTASVVSRPISSSVRTAAHPSQLNTSTAMASPSSSREDSGGSGTVPNVATPFYPQLRSTGDASADQELAALYNAREAMRRNLGG